MKKLSLTTFTIITIIASIQAQCIIEAGMDRSVCLEEILEGPMLNGQAIEGDFVHFAWYSEYYASFSDQYYYASDMLNDTTLIQPTVEQHFDKTVKYFLTGITSSNETCMDSAVLNFSDWTFILLDKMTGKLPEDTIQLWIGAESNWPHVKYEWSPNFMISDTTVERPFVWNDTTTFYNLVITDSIGCSVTDDVFEVYIVSNSLEEEKELDLKIYPNPVQDNLTIQSNLDVKHIRLLDLNGRMLINSKQQDIDVSGLESGNYVVQVESSDRKVITKLIQIVRD